MDESSTNSTSAPTLEEEEEELSALPLPWSVTAAICITVAIATAVGGNVLVLLSYRRDRGLRSVHNLYLVHLAFTDLMLGAVSMPFYLVYTIMYWTWPFGRVVCKIFLVEDFTFCGMPVLIVVLIAWDRLALVRNGARYSMVETKRKAYVRLAVCWVFSFLLYSPAILFWDLVRGWSVVPEDDCDVEFHEEIEFTLAAEIIAFAVPFISLAVINIFLFLELRRSGRKITAHGSGDRKQVQHQQNRPQRQQGSSPSAEPQLSTFPKQDPLGEASSSSKPTTTNNWSTPVAEAASSLPQSTSQETSNRLTTRKINRKSRHTRVGIILVLLVLALVICWLPYSVTTIMIAVCGSCVDTDLYEFFNWLLWIKSCVNPFLYAYNSPRFRKNFIELLSPVLPARCRAERGVKTDHVSARTIS